MSLRVDIRKNLGNFLLETQFEADGGVTGILGASGCGKSMTLKCIAGIVKPDEGRIELDGTVLFDSAAGINLKPQKRRTGFLFQNYALFPNMTVRQNLMTALRPFEKNKKKAAKAAEAITEKFCLSGLEDHRPNQLSGGQQQRVALARIFLTRPNILMLDEPFSALDDFLKWKLELELTDVLEEFNGSTLFVSHSREEIYRICDRVCVMERGKSSDVISVNQLFEAPGSRAAAVLSGCKNYSGACALGEGRVYAKDWGVTLTCAGEISGDINCIGVRSHYIVPVRHGGEQEAENGNTFRCKVVRVVEDVFSVIVMLLPESAGEGSGGEVKEEAQLRMEVDKKIWQEFSCQGRPGSELWVHIDSGNIMALR